MSPLGMLAVAMMIVGGLMALIYSLIYYIKAFKVSVLIGVLNLLIGIAYLMMEPKNAWKPFVLAWIGCFLLIGGGILAETQGVFLLLR